MEGILDIKCEETSKICGDQRTCNVCSIVKERRQTGTTEDDRSPQGRACRSVYEIYISQRHHAAAAVGKKYVGGRP